MKKNIDFTIMSDPYWIKVSDFSYWGNIKDKPSIIEITIPGKEAFITKYFDKKKVNGFNSILLDINCETDCGETELVTLPDGVYKITVKGSPSKFSKTKYYLKTDETELELAKVFSDTIDKGDYHLIENKLTEIEFLLKASSYELKLEKIRNAGIMFQKAASMVDKLKTCRYC